MISLILKKRNWLKTEKCPLKKSTVFRVCVWGGEGKTPCFTWLLNNGPVMTAVYATL